MAVIEREQSERTTFSHVGSAHTLKESLARIAPERGFLFINFFAALHLESSRLVNMTNRPAPDCPPNAVCIGPTRVDYSVLPPKKVSGQHPDARIPSSEAKLLDRWRKQDLASFYKQSRSNKYR